MKRIYQIFAFIILLGLFIIPAFTGGTYHYTSLTWGSEEGTASDTLIGTAGKDTSSTFYLRMGNNTGRGKDQYTDISIMLKVVESTLSDSGYLQVCLDVSEDGTTWYPYTEGKSAVADTVDLYGTANQTIYHTVHITSCAPALYGRIRANSISAATDALDSVCVTDLQVGMKY